MSNKPVNETEAWEKSPGLIWAEKNNSLVRNCIAKGATLEEIVVAMSEAYANVKPDLQLLGTSRPTFRQEYLCTFVNPVIFHYIVGTKSRRKYSAQVYTTITEEEAREDITELWDICCEYIRDKHSLAGYWSITSWEYGELPEEAVDKAEKIAKPQVIVTCKKCSEMFPEKELEDRLCFGGRKAGRCER
jgi:predicted RNase H-like HicB family nuclease